MIKFINLNFLNLLIVIFVFKIKLFICLLVVVYMFEANRLGTSNGVLDQRSLDALRCGKCSSEGRRK